MVLCHFDRPLCEDDEHGFLIVVQDNVGLARKQLSEQRRCSLLVKTTRTLDRQIRRDLAAPRRVDKREHVFARRLTILAAARTGRSVVQGVARGRECASGTPGGVTRVRGPIQTQASQERWKALLNSVGPRLAHLSQIRHKSVTAEIGAPGGIRTHDPRLRRAVLYPAELQARF